MFRTPQIRNTSRRNWLIKRHDFLTGTDSRKIVGPGYAGESALMVWPDKVYKPEPEDADDAPEKYSKALASEDYQATLFAMETGLIATRPRKWTMFQHPQIEWLAATLDFMADVDGVTVPVEMKAVLNDAERSKWQGDDPPLMHWAQVQIQMACTDSPRAALVGWIDQLNVRVFWIERDDRYLAALIRRLTQFWNLVKAKTPPQEIDWGSAATAKALATMYPERKELSVRQLPNEAMPWIDLLDATKAVAARAKETRTECENRLKAAIGDCGYAVCGDRVIKWRDQVSERRAQPPKTVTSRPFTSVKKLPEEPLTFLEYEENGQLFTNCLDEPDDDRLIEGSAQLVEQSASQDRIESDA